MNSHTEAVYNKCRMMKSGLLYMASLILLLTAFIACESHSKDEILLEQALIVIADNPAQAYSLLDSIRQPQKMDEKRRMQYQLALVESKYRTDRDITGNTEIEDIYNYFLQKKDVKNTANAALQTGAMFFDNNNLSRAFKYYSIAVDKATQSGNSVIAGKAHNNVGLIYYRQGIYDSAIIHLKKALTLFSEKEMKGAMLQTLHTMSSSYLLSNNLTETDKYIERGLALASETGSKRSIAVFLNLKGMVRHELEQYNEAKPYYSQALVQTDNIQDSVRYLLNFALLYNETNHLDSVKYYNDIINKNIDNITYKYTLKTHYYLMSIYYQKTNNISESLRYKELENEVNEEIIYGLHDEKLTKVKDDHTDAMKDEQLARQQVWLYVAYLLSLLLIVISISIYFYKRFRNRQLTLKNSLLEESNKVLESHNLLLQKDADAINFLVDVLKTIIKKDSALNQKLKALQETYRTTEKPQIFVEIEEMVACLQDLINEQLLIISKRYFDKQVIALLNDREVLYVTLRSIGFNEDEIYATSNFSNIEHEKFKMIKYRIRKKFKDNGLSDKSISLLLLSEKSILLKDNQVLLLSLQERIDQEKEQQNDDDKIHID